MAGNAERAEADWEAVDEEKEGLDGDDAVDETVEQFLREHCVLLDKFREVVQSRCWFELSVKLYMRKMYSKRYGNVPIANVKKAKPRMTPTYPRAGNIHMLAMRCAVRAFDSCQVPVER
jgi:hypothetical protein